MPDKPRHDRYFIQSLDLRGQTYYCGRIRLDLDSPLVYAAGWIVGVGPMDGDATATAIVEELRVVGWMISHGLTADEARGWFSAVRAAVEVQ